MGKCCFLFLSSQYEWILNILAITKRTECTHTVDGLEVVPLPDHILDETIPIPSLPPLPLSNDWQQKLSQQQAWLRVRPSWWLAAPEIEGPRAELTVKITDHSLWSDGWPGPGPGPG